jgi:hypothetical protein
MRKLRRRVVLAALGAAPILGAAPAPSSAADPAHTILIQYRGPEHLRVRVLATDGGGCTGGHPIFAATLDGTADVPITSSIECACMSQTFADSDDAPWTPPARFCRPYVCRGHGRAHVCVLGPDPTLRILVESPG